MRKAIFILALMAFGGSAFAGTLIGMAGYIVPGLNLEGEPVFAFLPQLVLGWGEDPLTVAGLSFTTVPGEGPWVQELDIKIKAAVHFNFLDFFAVHGYIAPIGEMNMVLLTNETGEAQLALEPAWGFRVGAQAFYSYGYGSVFVDFQPGMGIIPGFMFGVWLEG